MFDPLQDMTKEQRSEVDQHRAEYPPPELPEETIRAFWERLQHVIAGMFADMADEYAEQGEQSKADRCTREAWLILQRSPPMTSMARLLVGVYAVGVKDGALGKQEIEDQKDAIVDAYGMRMYFDRKEREGQE